MYSHLLRVNETISDPNIPSLLGCKFIQNCGIFCASGSSRLRESAKRPINACTERKKRESTDWMVDGERRGEE